ncbi:contact-dependent growth inhibition system immunity protein [Nocardioides caricicola]|uniref:Contact-dependent growth inhibition system immunity protein n=1 Tax=Nocardioides caricicola TaxID=634770 RepID=A0ABW0N0J3_9ACTN
MEMPGLAQLMGGWLHQDFDIIGTVDENIDEFARKNPRRAATLPDEVAWLLSAHDSESELQAVLDRLGCDVMPDDGVSYREWLTHIADRVRAATSDGTNRRET